MAVDGTPYAQAHALALGDGHRWTWDNDAMKPFVEECKCRVREAMASTPDDAETLIRKILTLTQPPCMHRFTRYMDIQLTSIGALKWRGVLPVDDVPKAAWQEYVDDALAALQDWVEGRPPKTKLASDLHGALGSPTEKGGAILRDFLLPQTSGNMGVSWDWLVPKAKADGTNACAVFRRD